jgi:hypothetical protein
MTDTRNPVDKFKYLMSGPMTSNKPEPTEADTEILAEMQAQIWSAGAAIEDSQFFAKMLWRNGFVITKREA